jgi:MFS transporter, PAT family, beta-lactamase induction signal transducer AmpG
MLAFTLASATQDIAADAWVVDVAEGRDLGPINGLRAAAFRVAMIAAGGVALLVADRWGWQAA